MLIDNLSNETQYLVDEFNRYVKEFGKYPKRVDIDRATGYPSASAYYTHWKSWKELLTYMGVVSEDGWYKNDESVLLSNYKTINSISELNNLFEVKRSTFQINKKAVSLGLKQRNFWVKRKYTTLTLEDRIYSGIQAIKDLSKDIGKCPTVEEYDTYAKINGLLARRNLEKQTNTRFSQLCSLHIQDENIVRKSNHQLLAELISIKRMIGRVPRGNELVKYGLSERKTYARAFGMSYQELIKSLGWELHEPEKLYKTNEELLADIEMLYNEIGRVPSETDVSDCKFCASYSTYRKRFGSFKTVFDILGIELTVDQSSSLGYICVNSAGEICRSTYEKIISDLFIKNNITYRSEVKYKEFDHSLKQKWVMDWYIPNKNIYVEYFGLYNEKEIHKNSRIGRYSRKTKKKIEYCNEHLIPIIDLYKDDIKNDCEGLLRKFKSRGIYLSR